MWRGASGGIFFVTHGKVAAVQAQRVADRQKENREGFSTVKREEGGRPHQVVVVRLSRPHCREEEEEGEEK